MSEKFILALDQGTTSSRAIVFDHEGRALSIVQREFLQIYPRPGWVEHDPYDIWSSQSAVAVEALGRAGITADDLAAIGITNQRETTLLWDRRTGRPIGPAIVWQDRRTAAQCLELQREGFGTLIAERTGLRLDPYFSATKLAWLLDTAEGARHRAQAGELAFGTVDTWLVWQLTGGRVHVTDPSNAARTLLFNIHTGRWDEELLAVFDIPAAILPEVRTSSEVYGRTDTRVFPGSVPIAGIAGDQQAALFGQGCTKAGMAKNTYGTGCFLLMHTGTNAVPSRNNLLTTVAWQWPGCPLEYALEGSVFIGGAVIQWLRDELKLVSSAEECSALAASVPDSNGVFFVPAFTGLGAPYWDPAARGTLTGLTRGASRAHICRAAIEAIAFQSADLLHAMERDADIRLEELRVDGGVTRSEALLQFQADLLQTPVVRPANFESTAVGAAALAGLAVGFWSDPSEIVGREGAERRMFLPQRDAASMQALSASWRRAVERARDWARD